MVVIIYDDRFLRHYSEGYSHPESPSRLVNALESLRTHNILQKFKVVSVDKPNYELPHEVHDRAYVNYVKELSSKGFNYIDGDTYVNSYTYEVATLALTASLKGYELREAYDKPVFVLVRPPGHHAGIHGSALGAPTLGFCIFNNVAVLAKHLINIGFKKVLIVDIDAHHGNGTQEIFMEEPRVIHVDLHQRGIYPGTGSIFEVGLGEAEGTKINIPLPGGSGDNTYKEVFDELLDPLICSIKPDYILISAGYDAHYSDPLTGLKLSSLTYYLYFKRLLNLSSKLCGKRLIAVLEGGYSEGLTKGLPNSIAALAESEPYVIESESLGVSAKNVISEVKKVISKYWGIN
ncbi:MAG: histone deacetylase [Sulfolobales archaeon]|nr:histone deacetylase [Sulfolobales archaeon]MCX8185849.1 histone deacetylase [Sulfolobales archaeon]MDW7969106.1 histone deacetylase [Sulfolobales archaeon]